MAVTIFLRGAVGDSVWMLSERLIPVELGFLNYPFRRYFFDWSDRIGGLAMNRTYFFNSPYFDNFYAFFFITELFECLCDERDLYFN